MTLSQACRVFSQHGIVGPCIQRNMAEALHYCVRAEKPKQPLLWLSTSSYEGAHLAQTFHAAHQILCPGPQHFVSIHLEQFWQDNQLQTSYLTENKAACTSVYLHGLNAYAPKQRKKCWNAIQQFLAEQSTPIWLLCAYPEKTLHPTERDVLQKLFPTPLKLPPLWQRHTDIDALITHYVHTQGLNQHATLKGFSLESIAHIHRAVVQTQKDTHALLAFLDQLIHQAHAGSLPTHEGFI
ncbi:MAG: hypothetical protein AAGJ35_14310, partial [Myxococcota bacterium]